MKPTDLTLGVLSQCELSESEIVDADEDLETKLRCLSHIERVEDERALPSHVPSAIENSSVEQLQALADLWDSDVPGRPADRSNATDTASTEDVDRETQRANAGVDPASVEAIKQDVHAGPGARPSAINQAIRELRAADHPMHHKQADRLARRYEHAIAKNDRANAGLDPKVDEGLAPGSAWDRYEERNPERAPDEKPSERGETLDIESDTAAPFQEMIDEINEEHGRKRADAVGIDPGEDVALDLAPGAAMDRRDERDREED